MQLASKKSKHASHNKNTKQFNRRSDLKQLKQRIRLRALRHVGVAETHITNKGAMETERLKELYAEWRKASEEMLVFEQKYEA